MHKKRVVIVGGGFAGVRAALDLARHIYDLKIIIIDKQGFHSYPSDYYKLILRGTHRKGHLSPAKFSLLFSSVTISLAEIFEGQKNVELVRDEVTGIDAAFQAVRTASGKTIIYDWLILAAGSVTNFYGIPGLRERAFELKTTADALNIRNAIDEIFSRRAKHENIMIVVGGGGFSGCEVVSELAMCVKNLAKIHGHPMKNISILVIEAARSLLSNTHPWVRAKAKKRLQDLGVEAILSDPVIDVKDGVIELKSGKTIHYDVFIWTAGVKACPLAEKISGLNLGKGSCIVVNKYLQINLDPVIFAVGDVAFCEAFERKPLPMTAQTAISQGQYVAYIIKRILHGRNIFVYHPYKSKFIIPLGGHYALADLGWVRFEGFFAWALKRLVALKYFFSILPFHKALKLWWKGVKF
ncbi:NAD(P)/FAD-dependent oxidoreductase [Patescibacteria group bacterium]|nr:NAD(P)/FAD-dependent oxidoreductase [Patescibacteria group bacterium]